jgi:biopolymer transport protein ExbD
MARKDHKTAPMSLTSLMDVFTNLVFFLLLSQGVVSVDEPPKEVVLPDSFVDTKPRPTLNILVSDDEVFVDGAEAVTVAEVAASQGDLIGPIHDKLVQIRAVSMGLNDATKEGNNEVTILAHSAVPFKVMKRVMATCTYAGYNKISLAVRENSGVTAPPPKS